jgi:cell division protein ZapA
MAEETVPVAVKILDKEFRVACKEGEEEALLAAATLLNDRMLEVKSSGKVIGADQIAVMAALNLTHELLQQKEDFGGENSAVSKRVEAMQEKIESSLQNLQQMEF